MVNHLEGKRIVILHSSAAYHTMMASYDAGVITLCDSRVSAPRVDMLDSCDLLLFTGGADVSPHLYGEKKHPETYNDEQRDTLERNWFLSASKRKIPMAGICRGGQFLNVMNGGKMRQHVAGHATGNNHLVVVPHLNKEVMCSSTHHQMMLPNEDMATLLGYGEILLHDGQPDAEIVYYPDTNCLCFQPHPEFFPRGHECPDLFVELVGDYLFGNAV